MQDWKRGVRLGAGLVGTAWGIYRLTRGQRDWVTLSVATSSASMLAREMMGKRSPAARMMKAVSKTAQSMGVPAGVANPVARAAMAAVNAMT